MLTKIRVIVLHIDYKDYVHHQCEAAVTIHTHLLSSP